MSFLHFASVGALVLGAGCVGFEQDELEYGEVEQAVGCPSWMCGDNSPIIATYPFYALREKFNLETQDRFTITGVKKFATWYAQLDVDRAKILVKDSVGNVLLSGAGLANVEIRIQHTDANGTRTYYAMKIFSVGTTPYYADNNGAAPNPLHETYRIDVSDVAGGPQGTPIGNWRNVCNNPNQSRYETLGMPGDAVLVFEGDVIDKNAKRVIGLDNTQFNIGCAGHTLAKLALMGHTEPSKLAPANYFTTTSERTTVIKMLSADYCGVGAALTVAGQPLEWMDNKGWMKYSSPWWALDLEARWTPNGVSCLNTPRIDANWTQAGENAFGINGVWDEIHAACGAAYNPPPCNGSVLDLQGHHLNSANP